MQMEEYSTTQKLKSSSSSYGTNNPEATNLQPTNHCPTHLEIFLCM